MGNWLSVKRKPRFLISVILLFIVVTSLLTVSCSRGYVPGNESLAASAPSTSSANGPVNGVVQSSDGGGVTIDVKWLGWQGNSLVFDVVMDTHSVNLDPYDLKQLAVLRDSEGKEYVPSTWDSAPGDHHRTGKLAFSKVDSLSQSKVLKLIIKDVAGVKERLLTWKLG